MILFFIHRFNDIDHFSPTIYKMASSTKQKIMVLCLNPDYDIHNDFRLSFLKKQHNVTIDYLYNTYKPSIKHKILAFLMQATDKRSFKKEPFGFFTKHLFILMFHRLKQNSKLIKRSVMECYGEKWISGMMGKYDPSVMIFDYAATKRLYNTQQLTKVAKQLQVPIIYLPHGIPLFLEHSQDYDRAKKDQIEIMENQCDSMVFYHRWWHNESISYGLNPSKTTVLGIPRHCREWQDILHNIIPSDRFLEEKGKGKLKIVYMDSGPDRYHEHKNNAEKTLDMISKLDYVSFIYKPHTRRNHVNLNVPPNVVIQEKINSVNLIKWADVVIGMHSSIMIEVLIQGKIYISPTYFRSRKMIYEEYCACCMVESVSDLENILNRIRNESNFQPYPEENIKKFLQDVIYNGDDSRDILGDFTEHILGIIKKGNQDGHTRQMQ